jgi:hypothetical protein
MRSQGFDDFAFSKHAVTAGANHPVEFVGDSCQITDLRSTSVKRAMHGVTIVKMRLGGAFEFQTGPDAKHIMKVLRLPPPRRDAKARLRAS